MYLDLIRSGVDVVSSGRALSRMSADFRTILDEREVFECKNAHVVCCRPNGDVLISISNTDSVELHRFNATNSKRSAVKRKGLTATTFDKRSKVAA